MIHNGTRQFSSMFDIVFFFSCSDFPSTYHIHAESLRFILLRIDYVFVLFCTHNTKARVTLNFFPRRFTVA